MTRLLERASELVGRPVVTLGGEDVAQVRDVVFDRAGEVRGFTLAGRGTFSGPLKTWLPWTGVHGFGPDAVMVSDEAALVRPEEDPTAGEVIGDEVLTRSGTRVGTVTDAVVRLEGGVLDVVGYEIDPAEAAGSGDGGTRLIPLPDTLAVTGGRLMVPDEAVDYLSDDLTGFASAVDTFRDRLRGAGASA